LRLLLIATFTKNEGYKLDEKELEYEIDGDG